MNSESDYETEILETLKRKKGVINYDKYNRNIIKNANVRGESHINYAGKEIREKVPATTCMYVYYNDTIQRTIVVNKYSCIKI